MNRRAFVTALAAAGLASGRAAAESVIYDRVGDANQTLPRGQWPEFVADTSDVQRLYRYAVEHGDDLRYIPCYCGCVDVGHRGNRDCYVKSLNADGTITFTSHAAT